MESIKLRFQDWSDACEYAKECVPDLSFAVPEEPFSALASIAAVCFLIWWWNERTAKAARSVQRQIVTQNEGLAAARDAIEPAPVETIRPALEKRAA